MPIWTEEQLASFSQLPVRQCVFLLAVYCFIINAIVFITFEQLQHLKNRFCVSLLNNSTWNLITQSCMAWQCCTLLWSCWGEVWLSRGVLWLRGKVRCYLFIYFSMFQNNDMVHRFTCYPTFQKLAYLCLSVRLLLVILCSPWPGLSTICPQPRIPFQSPEFDSPCLVTLQEGWCHLQPCLPISPAESRCHCHGLVQGLGTSPQAAQLPAGVVGWALGRKIPGWQAYCGLLCRVCVSYLMYLMTRPNFCESARLMISWLYYIILCVLLYVHMYKIHNIFRHSIVVIISLTNL